MRARPRIAIGKLVLSILLCYSAPIAAYKLLDAGGPLIPILGYGTLVEGLFILRLRLRRRSRTLSTALLAVLIAAGALVVGAAIDITPSSAFLAWFKLVTLGKPGGTIAYMFCVDTVFFSSLFAGLLVNVDFATPLFGYFFMNAVLAAVVLENLAVAAAAAGLLAAFPVYRAFRLSKGAGFAPAISSLEVLFTAGAIAVAATALMIPNRLVDRAFSISLAGPVSRLFPGFPFLYNVPGYGHSFSPSDLGGRPALTSRPVLRVVGEPGSTIYLRTAVYDTYTGTGWALSEEAVNRAKSPSTTLRRSSSNAETTVGGSIRVTILIDFLATVPNTLDTTEIVPLRGEFPPLVYGSAATGYLLSIPVTAGFQLADRLSPTRQGAVALRPKSIDRPEYLQTGRVPGEVRTLAMQLRRSSPMATIAAIRSYLSDNYAYSLDVKPFPPGSDAVSDFLFGAHAGYCVQFASAFTILARLDGIPARYVTGFLVNLPDNSDSSVITGLSAHSWSEVFVDGRWRTIEATPPMMRASELDRGYYQIFNPSGSAATRRQLEAVMGARVPPPPQTVSEHPPFPLLPAAAGLAGLAALLLALRAVVLALQPRGMKIRRIVRQMLKRTNAMELPDPARRGWYAWAAAAGQATSRRAVLRRAGLVVQSLFFAATPPGRRESRFLREVYRCLRSASRRRGHR